MSLKALGIAGCVVLAGTAGRSAQVVAAQAAVTPAEREAHWRQDLQALGAGLKASGFRIADGLATRGQKDFTRVYPSFDAEIASLTADLPILSDSEVSLRLMRLMASAHIAHNQIETPIGMGFASGLPLTLHWYADGLAVVGATPDYAAVIGARLLRLGEKTPDQFLTDVAPYISYENDTQLRHEAPSLMTTRAILQHFDMIAADGHVPVTFATVDAHTVTIPVGLGPRDVPRTDIGEALRITPPVYRGHPGAWYWSQYLTESQTLFVQYNLCANDAQHQFGEVAKRAMAELDTHTVNRVVIDLRWNGGGNETVIGPLKNGLASRLKALGHVYVLIGPGTFSSAVDNAVDLRQSLSATLIGEATGGMPGGYGQVSTLTLPNSKLVVRFTTKRWGPNGGWPLTLTPDVAAPLRLADVLAGRDPALDAAISGRR